ncbi:MAG: hypothetical protein H0X50_03660 [Nitrosopumilus sp.]|nr:hypothetical protein [Nitrosopumilus sp.]
MEAYKEIGVFIIVYNLNTGPYVCSICNKKTTRKWNARRHNSKVHMNRGQIYDRLNNLISDPILSASEDNLKSKDSVGGFHMDVGESNNNNVVYPHSTINKTIKINTEMEDEIFYKEIEKLGPMLVELNNRLLNYPTEKRDLIRKMMITRTFSSHDPSDTLKENLSFLKNRKYANEIRDCISSCCNIPKYMANEILRKSILNEHKYKID